MRLYTCSDVLTLTDVLYDLSLKEEVHAGEMKPSGRLDSEARQGVGIRNRGPKEKFGRRRRFLKFPNLHPIPSSLIYSSVILFCAWLPDSLAPKRITLKKVTGKKTTMQRRRWITNAELSDLFPPSSLVAMDLETEVVDLKIAVPHPVLATFCDGKTTAFMWIHGRATGFSPIFQWELIFHNAAFDLTVLAEDHLVRRNEILKALPRIHDTMILDQLLRLATGGEGPGKPGDHLYAKNYDGTLPKRSLAELTKEYLNENLAKGEVRTSFGNLRGPESLTEEQIDYACKDAEATFAVYDELKFRTQTWPPNEYGYLTEAVQIGAGLALWEISRRGLSLDESRLAKQEKISEEAREEAASALRLAGYLAKSKGNRVQRKQLNESALRTRLAEIAASLGLSPPKTPLGKVSLRRETWDEYVDRDPLIRAFVTYKRHEKRQSTFFKNWRKTAIDGVVHPQYRTLVATGRTSCFSPNIQQVPRRQGSFREIFMSPDNFLWELDYSAIELVAVAQCCLSKLGHSRLAELLNAGKDVHRYMAAQVYQKPEEEVTKDQRFLAKMVNFGFWGGMGAKTFVQHAWNLGRLRLDEGFAREIHWSWLQAFPEAEEWLTTAVKAEKNLVPYFRALQHPIIVSQRDLRNFLEKTNINKGLRRLVFDALNNDKNLRAHLRLDSLFAQPYRTLISKRQGKRSLYEWCLWREMRTLTGRVRAPTSYTEYLNGQFQGLAADGAKLALAALWEKKVPVVAFIHDSVLIDAVGSLEVEETARIMIQEMRRVTPDVRVGVEATGPYHNWGVALPETETQQFWSDDSVKTKI